MFRLRRFRYSIRCGCPLLPALLLAMLTLALPGRAQNQPQQPGQATPDQATPDSGGPGADSGVIAIPKKKEATEEAPPPAPAAPKFKNPEGAGNYTLRVDVPEVTVDVGVLLERPGNLCPI